MQIIGEIYFTNHAILMDDSYFWLDLDQCALVYSELLSLDYSCRYNFVG